VDDLVEGIVRLVHSDHPGPMNLGNPHEISVADLAAQIRELVGSSSEISFVPRPVDDPTVRQPDTTLAREVLQWEPKVEMDDGLTRTIEWFREELGRA
jgi:dTDP-glucose 4,6-dehydratase